MTTTTIQLKDVRLALDSAKLRRISHGRTCLMCAMSGAPLIRVDCNTHTWTFASMREASIKSHRLSGTCGPMQRGHIGSLIDRTRDAHGLKEVTRAFGTGLRKLKAENLYILNGGAA